jgi:Chaperone of endosialidase
MDPFILKKATRLFINAFLLMCFGLMPTTQAVVPPPDGGYPGFNTAEGQNALLHVTTGAANTAVGWFSLENVTTGSANTGVGAGTLVLNTADNNTAIGAGALLSNITGGVNTANGAFALFNNTTGSRNNATGSNALFTNTIGTSNNAYGFRALFSNITGLTNNAFGDQALHNNTAGNGNSAFGDSALFNTTGQDNTAVGSFAGVNLTTGSSNVAVGSAAGTGVTTASNAICIGAGVAGFNVDDSCFIGNIRDALVAPDAVAVLIDSTGKLGTTSGSSRRFKKEIKPMDAASEAILALKPVSFRYKGDNTNTPQFGLIAEQVAHVIPELVVRDKEGKPYSVRYDQVNAMLLNEFLKEHRKNDEQEATIGQLKASAAKQEATVSELKRRIELLTAQLKEPIAQGERTDLDERSSAVSSGQPVAAVHPNRFTAMKPITRFSLD